MVRFILPMAAAVALAFASVACAAPPEPPPVEAYGALPAMEQVTLSPSGDRLAFIARQGDTRRLFVATTDNKPLMAIDLGDAKIADVSWAGETYVLVTTLITRNLGLDFTVSKHELEGVDVFNVNTQHSFNVFQRDKMKVAGAVFGDFGTAQIDGRWYGFFGGVTYEQNKGGGYLGHTWPDLYRVDLETGELHLAASGKESIRGWVIDGSGQPVARSLYAEKTSTWRVESLGAGARELASGTAAFNIADLGLGRKPGTLLMSRPGEDGGSVLQELPLAGGAPTLADNTDDAEVAVLDDATRVWIGQRDRGDDRPIRFYDPAAEMRWKAAAKAFAGYRAQIVSWSTDFNRMIVLTDGKDDSGTYWFIDVARRNARPLGGAYPAVKPAQVGPVRMIDYKAGDGLALHGVLTLPPGRDSKNLPLVVLPHGGPEARDYPGFDWWAQAFASRGYAVFQPNFRGSAGYGQDFVKAGYGQWGRKMQSDISDGIAALATEGVVDPKRACIVGGSYGGYAALAGVTVQQGLYRCAVSVAGLSDLSGFLVYHRDLAGDEIDASERFWKTFMGVSGDDESHLSGLSPVRLATRADAPILLIHGREDTIVPFEQSLAMEKALRGAGKPVETLWQTGGDHNLSQAQTRIDMLRAAVAFVEKYNPADGASAAGKTP